MEVDLVDLIDLVDEVDENVRIPVERQIIRNRPNFFLTLDNEQFIKRFRITKNTTLLLLEKIEHELEHPDNRSNSVSSINQLLITLHVYATDGHLLSVGDLFCVDKSTVSRIVSKVTKLIAGLQNEYIFMPRNRLEVYEMQQKFYNISGFPKIVALINDTHVKIISPGGNDAEIFRNRKGYFSVNVHVVGDADFSIRDIVARWPGSTHDSTIFSNSRIKHKFDQHEFNISCLLGDNGYMNMNYLLTPFVNPRNEAERNYNYCHVRTRVRIENIFGIWKRRFPILAYGCRLNLENVLNVIVAIAVLHNLAILKQDPDPPLEHEQELYEAIINENVDNLYLRNEDNNFRRQLLERYFHA